MSRLNLLFVFAFIGLVVWVTLFSPQLIGNIQEGALVIFRPFMEASDRLEEAVEDLGEEPATLSEWRERLLGVERERDQLRLEVTQLDEILNENNQLRRALQYTERSPISLVAARVVHHKPTVWHHTVLIDKGRGDGIEVDYPAVVPVGDETALVGKVSEVIGEHNAVVILLIDEVCQVSARLDGTQEQGIVSGERGAMRLLPSLRLRYLTKESGAYPGMRVYSSGAGELFPPNLLIGEVIQFDVGVIDAEALVIPSVDFSRLKDIFVLLPLEGAEESGDPVEIPARPIPAPAP